MTIAGEAVGKLARCTQRGKRNTQLRLRTSTQPVSFAHTNAESAGKSKATVRTVLLSELHSKTRGGSPTPLLWDWLALERDPPRTHGDNGCGFVTRDAASRYGTGGRALNRLEWRAGLTACVSGRGRGGGRGGGDGDGVSRPSCRRTSLFLSTLAARSSSYADSSIGAPPPLGEFLHRDHLYYS